MCSVDESQVDAISAFLFDTREMAIFMTVNLKFINLKSDVTDLGNAFNDEIEELAINLNFMNVLYNLGG